MTQIIQDNGYTPEQQQEYMRHGGNECPVCHSENISSMSPIYDDTNLIIPVNCLACKERWTELYSLVNIEPAQ